MPQIAFGSSPGPFGDQGIPPAPTAAEQAAMESGDIHALKIKYVGEGSDATTLEDPQVFSLAPGQVQKVFDDPSVIVNSIIVSVETGTLKIWLKDIGAPLNVSVGSPRAGDTAHHIVPSGGAAAQYMYGNVKGRAISIGNDPGSAGNAKGCVTLVRL